MRRKYDRWDVPKVFPHLLVFNFFKLIQHETCRFWFVNADVIFHDNLLTCFEGCSWKISGVSWNLQRAISADGSEIRLTSPVEVGHFFSLFTKVFAPSKRWLFGIFFIKSNYQVVVSNIFYFHPYLGKISNLTNLLQRGWFNHQPDQAYYCCHNVTPCYSRQKIRSGHPKQIAISLRRHVWESGSAMEFFFVEKTWCW